MKKLRLSAVVILSFACIVALAQAIRDVNSSVGNGKAMEHNLNEPNAINPARDNIQKYEKDGIIEKNKHPEKSLSNSYNTKLFEEKK